MNLAKWVSSEVNFALTGYQKTHEQNGKQAPAELLGIKVIVLKSDT